MKSNNINNNYITVKLMVRDDPYGGFFEAARQRMPEHLYREIDYDYLNRWIEISGIDRNKVYASTSVEE